MYVSVYIYIYIKRTMLYNLRLLQYPELSNQPINQPNQWGTVILQNLIVTQLSKKTLGFYGNRVFITVVITARHWTQS